nr:MAG TPA: hypothetical protein [Caudoviricetes sp.]DAS38251.1 MAG TPA: hypothetical protein [Bacteriophage sp.]
MTQLIFLIFSYFKIKIMIFDKNKETKLKNIILFMKININK